MPFFLAISGVPAGIYTLEFKGIELRPADDKFGYGPGLCWQFCVCGGDFDGEPVSRTTGDRPTAKNAAGKFFRAVADALPAPGVKFDFDSFKGLKFSGIVEDAPSGSGTRVASVVRLKE